MDLFQNCEQSSFKMKVKEYNIEFFTNQSIFEVMQSISFSLGHAEDSLQNIDYDQKKSEANKDNSWTEEETIERNIMPNATEFKTTKTSKSVC